MLLVGCRPLPCRRRPDWNLLSRRKQIFVVLHVWHQLAKADLGVALAQLIVQPIYPAENVRRILHEFVPFEITTTSLQEFPNADYDIWPDIDLVFEVVASYDCISFHSFLPGIPQTPGFNLAREGVCYGTVPSFEPLIRHELQEGRGRGSSLIATCGPFEMFQDMLMISSLKMMEQIPRFG